MTYSPILKTKQGEFDAISSISAEVAEHLHPIFDLVRPTQKTKNRKPIETEIEARDRCLEGLAEKFAGFNGLLPSFSLDIFDWDLQWRMSDGSHPVDSIFSQISAKNAVCSIGVGLDRDPDYWDAVRRNVTSGRADGLFFRFQPDDLQTPNIAKIDYQDMHDEWDFGQHLKFVVLDWRAINVGDSEKLAARTIAFLNTMPQWDVPVYVSSGIIPRALSSILDTHSEMLLTREELLLWKLLKEHGIAYSDYGPVNADFVDLDIVVPIAPSVKYSTEENWYLARGESYRRHPRGYRQYKDIVRRLIQKPFFKGADYSWGDHFMEEKADESNGSGNAMQWVSANVSHHLALAVRQLHP